MSSLLADERVQQAEPSLIASSYGCPLNGRDTSSYFGSFGRPRTRSPTMLRWIWLVPPQIVSEREKKNDDIIGLVGYPSRRLVAA